MRDTFTFTATKGGLGFTDHTKRIFKQHLLNHERRRYVIQLLPKDESKKQRKFYHGALVPLVAYYQEGMSHRDWKDCDAVHGWLKQHFNAEVVIVNGKQEKVAKSSKGVLNEYIEKVQEWVQDNYEPPAEALNPKKYKHWRETIFPYGERTDPDNYIDYLVSIQVLRLPEQRVILNQ